jgi:hypothetical protein
MNDHPGRTRFLTFTLRCQPLPLAATIKRLLRCFKELRKTEWWKGLVTGGMWFLECKLGKNSQWWHPHLHVLAQGDRWISQQALANEWHKITGDSFIVDIREVKDPQQRAWYVTKYATKPCDATVIRNPERLAEFMTAIKGQRLYQSFGECTGFGQEENEPARQWKSIGRVEDLAAGAAEGNEFKRRWWEAALRKFPALEHFRPHPTNSDEEFIP